MSITPKNWSDFQHYHGRRPPWIKLHRKLLDDYDFCCLPLASRALAPMLWLIASEFENGTILLDSKALAFRLRVSEKELIDALTPLVHKGFFLRTDNASNLLAAHKQNGVSEREIEEEKEEERMSENKFPTRSRQSYPKDFEEQFWKVYPTTPVMSKKEAGGAWKRLSEADQQAAIAALPAFKAFLASKPDHPVVHACRFLSQRRFEGFAASPEPQNNGGWRPGLPTDAELRAKYGGKTEDVRGKPTGSPPVVESGLPTRPDEPDLVQGQKGQRGAQSLGGILRQTGLVADVLSQQRGGNDAPVSMAGMDAAGHARKLS